MLTVHLIPAFDDNYIFAFPLYGGAWAVVDPGDAAPVINHFQRTGRKPSYIFLTHHHNDHIGGAEELREKFGCKIIGHAADAARLPTLDIAVNDGDTIDIDGTKINVIRTDGHTIGHICYYLPDQRSIFVGDTLFVMGCGRLFEGSAEQMYASLQKLKALPDDISIYCAHEYTVANATFAHDYLPDNEEIKNGLYFFNQLRADNIPTVPTSLRAEKLSNPFLLADSAESFAAARKAKDQF